MRECYLTIIADIFINMMQSITSLFVLFQRGGNLGGFEVTDLTIRLGIYTVYILFALYKYNEENAVCRRVAIFISILQTAHSLQVLSMEATKTPFLKFIEM